MNLVLITGGAGFVGSNLAHRLLSTGVDVRILDDLSRSGVRKNLEWLREQHGSALDVRVADIRDRAAVQDAVEGVSHVFHFAAQVAVTTSVSNPPLDFEVNAGGTLNLLEAVRKQREPARVVYTSTNKVYGALKGINLRAAGWRYAPEDPAVAHYGISEQQPLDFHSPYGCSKGAADQYVLDYARTYSLKAIVMRMSCIYGPRQFGNEDQGWIAHFALKALRNESVTIYGDGRQVRDALFVDDLVDALLLAQTNADRLSGSAFNIGGGPQNDTSLLELLELIGRIRGGRPSFDMLDWRLGDQRYYVSDIRRFRSLTGWAPVTTLEVGVRRLCGWLSDTFAPPDTRRSAEGRVS